MQKQSFYNANSNDDDAAEVSKRPFEKTRFCFKAYCFNC